MKNIELVLNGLNCVNCAAKIEEKVKNKTEVNSATLNFVNKKLSFEVKETFDEQNVLKEVIDIIDVTEPGLDIRFFDGSKVDFDNSRNSGVKNEIKHEYNSIEDEGGFKIVIAAIIFYALGLVFKKMNTSIYIYLIPLVVAYIIAGENVILSAIRNISRGQVFDENFLMMIATIGAIAIGEYPEAVGVMIFYKIGEFMEEKAVNKSRKNIEGLMNIMPETANLVKSGNIVEVSPKKVNIGDIILVKVGEKVPLDGIVIKGESRFDTSAITGESVLRTIRKGDEIQSGIINKNAVVEVQVTKRFEDSTVSKILDMVENATSKKSYTENFITVFAKYYTPIVVVLAVLLVVFPPLFLQQPFSKWFYRGLIFLVVSCPCALVISIPLSYFSGIGVLSRNGVLMKGSNYIEAMKNVDTVVMDKTGTLTKGVFKVSNINIAENIKDFDLMKYAYIAESRSIHPIAISIVEYFKNNYDEVSLTDIESYEEISAKGVKVIYSGDLILAGNSKLLSENGISFEEIDNSSTKVYISFNGIYQGCIEIADEIKEGTKDAIDELRSIGVDNIIMLTGDGEKTAKEFADKLGIKKYFANLLPNQKVERIESIMSAKDNKKVAFVGDGINDAPVIARADVGISMGGVGSDAAIEASDVVIMTDEISKIATSIKISRFTSRIAWQNIIFAIGIKVLIMILSIFGFANMWLAIFADVGVTFLAVLNSLRIMTHKLK